MDNIIKNLRNDNWNDIANNIKDKNIQWDYLVDQTNGLLHYLAYHKKLDLIKMIDTDTLINIIQLPNIEGDTICHIAAKMNSTDLIILSINYYPEVIYERNRLLCTPLYYLISDQELIRQIISKVEIEDHYLNDEYTLLDYYILDKNISMVDFILEHIKTNKLSNNSIFTIILSENTTGTKIKLLEILLGKNGIDINTHNELYLSPLIVALYKKEFELVEYFVKSGTDLNYSGPENKDNPLVIAIRFENISIIKLLLDYGINTNVRDKYLKTPFHHIFSEHNSIPFRIKIKLIKKCNNINKTDNKYNSIFNLLMHNNNWKNYRNILEKYKLKIYLRNKDGIKPVDAVENRDVEIFLKMVYNSYINQLKKNIIWLEDFDNKISQKLQNNYDISSYKKNIIKKILAGQSYPIKMKNGNSIKFIVPPETNITHYSAYSYNYICFLYYILKKYPTIKIPSLVPEQVKNKTTKNLFLEIVNDLSNGTDDISTFKSLIKDYINHYPPLINHLIIWRSENNFFISPYIAEGIKETLDKFPDTKFILFKLTIITEKINHANILIYDVNNNYTERFDPYGKVPFYDSTIIDKILGKYFMEQLKDSKYLSPNETSITGISFQIFSDESNQLNYVENDPIGFCIPWCLWYIEMRAKNDIEPKILINKAIHEINRKENKIKDYIRNYSNYLDGEKNKILEGATIPKKYWYSLNMPHNYYKSYLKHMRKVFGSVME